MTIKTRIEEAIDNHDLTTYTLSSVREIIKVISELEERVKRLEEKSL